VPIPTPPAFPNPFASGSNTIGASFLGDGSTKYITLGTPASLTNILNPTHEFTVLVRTARNTATTAGFIIGQGDESNTTWQINSQGGSAASVVVGGVSITTGSGSIGYPTWNCIALVNRNPGSGPFQARAILDFHAGSAEISAGSQICTKDIIIGARRNATNADAVGYYHGNIGCIAIWNYALTDAQVHYAMGYITPTENMFGLYGINNGLVAYFPLNETSGSTAHDTVQGLIGTCSTSTCFSTAAYSKYPVVMIGDSLAAGSGSQTGQSPISQVISGGPGTRNMRSAYPFGFPGQNIAYILTQYELASYAPFLNWTQVYLTGIHDLGNNSGVLAGINLMISMLPHNRYLVMGQRIYAEAGVVAGVGDPTLAGRGDYGLLIRSQIDSMNNLFKSTYGSRFFDSQNNAQAQSAIHNNDLFQRRTPYQIAADDTHMMDQGYIPQSIGLEALLNSFGW